MLAGLATPLVLSVHSIVCMDFATSRHPRLAHHDLPALLRRRRHLLRLRHGDDAAAHHAPDACSLERYITLRHLEAMAKIMLADRHDGRLRLRDGVLHRLVLRATSTSGSPSSTARPARYAWCYWTDGAVQRARRRSSSGSSGRAPASRLLFVISILVNVGMWFERFVIIVTSLHRDFLPSSWGMFHPTSIEIGNLIGSFGLFFTLFLLFIRVLPDDRDVGDQGAVAEHGGARAHEPATAALGRASRRDRRCCRGARGARRRRRDPRRLHPLPGARPGRGDGAAALAPPLGHLWPGSPGSAARSRSSSRRAVIDWPLNVGGKPENSRRPSCRSASS